MFIFSGSRRKSMFMKAFCLLLACSLVGCFLTPAAAAGFNLNYVPDGAGNSLDTSDSFIEIFEDDTVNNVVFNSYIAMSSGYLFEATDVPGIEPEDAEGTDSKTGIDPVVFSGLVRKSLTDLIKFELIDLVGINEAYQDVDEEDLSVPEEAILRATADVNIRVEASMYSRVVRTLKEDQTVKVLEYVPFGWSKVEVNGETGYIITEYLADDLRTEVELLRWSEIRNIIPMNEQMQVIDVRTGLTFYLQCTSRGNHADVEPSSRLDTETIRAAFGGKWGWTPRPVWVVFDGRVFAASISGMPHSGSQISGNGMNGHICMHFRGSKTHNGNTNHERDHQLAITEGWDISQR